MMLMWMLMLVVPPRVVFSTHQGATTPFWTLLSREAMTRL